MNTYKTGDIVVYGTEGLCRVQEITDRKFGKEIIKYYVLKREGKGDSVTYVPVNSEKSISKMRPVLEREEILELIKSMPAETSPWIENDRERQGVFKEIMLYGDSRDIIRLIRALYIKREEQEKRGKKLHSADERVFKEAEKIINEEIAYVFGIPQEEVLNFIAETISEAGLSEK